MLRCREGDLAIVLKSVTGREGFIVTVGKFRGAVFAQNSTIMLFKAWEVTHSSYEKGRTYVSQDKDLLPLRPDELKETEETEKELTV